MRSQSVTVRRFESCLYHQQPAYLAERDEAGLGIESMMNTKSLLLVGCHVHSDDFRVRFEKLRTL